MVMAWKFERAVSRLVVRHWGADFARGGFAPECEEDIFLSFFFSAREKGWILGGGDDCSLSDLGDLLGRRRGFQPRHFAASRFFPAFLSSGNAELRARNLARRILVLARSNTSGFALSRPRRAILTSLICECEAQGVNARVSRRRALTRGRAGYL